MKRPAKAPNPQLNLPLLSAPATVMFENDQKNLILALIELLMSAASEGFAAEKNGGADESEAHR
jgi:hypothetical protein